ncbi:hypothetical protein CRG98_013665 [Punica granatum]|uniref:RNase H type-1 domain-containing protein n=1 Tax=Punica granatum TaxID=22663 RepID=A0A2I0KBP5_PUNGR|nr:hypothetical protein CRG98_013665 [Punica granatum]
MYRFAVSSAASDFLWGHSPKCRKIHLIGWDVITRPKLYGGLGLRNVADFNTALLGKISWGVLTKESELWVQCTASFFLLEDLIRYFGGDPHYGIFLVASAYDLVVGRPQGSPVPLWKYLWSREGPERICMFLWVAANEHLLTNVQRVRRNLAAHPYVADAIFLSPPLSMCFVIAHPLVQYGQDWCNQLLRLISSHGLSMIVKQWRYIHWTKPDEGWFKLNTDGASKGNPGLVGAGGLICDSNGNWMGGFMLNIGIASSMAAELWGARDGLELAWDMDYPRLILEIDSASVRDSMVGQEAGAPPLRPLLSDIRGLLARDWEITFRHTYSEWNCCAD